MTTTVLAFLAGVLALALLVTLYRLMQIRVQLGEARAEQRLLEARLEDLNARVAQDDRLKTEARSEFENVAARIFEREARVFQESSEKGLERLLMPLKDRLKEFEKRVEDSYHAEGRERHVLKAEVERLIQLNERMAVETNHLTRALTGDSKTQGDWGELVLETILESSGLRQGIEYTSQDSFSDDGGDRFRPDVLIRLPDEKQIIIDSKVSLTAYEAYVRCSDEAERARHLKAHLDSLMKHVDDLAEKHYPKLRGMRSPEFVFLFTPIEPAYLMAMRHDPDLATRAWRKGIAIVTSTTLFTSLKTVASIWRLEHQNRNAQEIADEAAKLYDKFVGFHDDFEKIGRTFEVGLQQYEDARRKLRDGQGNVFRKIELLRELGAAPNKRLKPELLEES